MSNSLRKRAVLPFALSLLLALAACEKVENPGPAPAATPAPQAAAPAASPAPKSATPNSFDEVTAQLDPGGDFYLYLSTAQWLGKLSHGLDFLHQMMLSGTGSQAMPNSGQADKIVAALKDIVQKSGIEEVTGVGASSFAVTADIHRNKFFFHHYQEKGSGILWSIYGKEPHDLTGLDFLPTDTGAAGFGDLDLAQIINFLRQEAAQSGIPEAQQAVTQWQTQFAGITGLQLDDVLGSLNGSIGMVVTLDATSSVSVPIQGAGSPAAQSPPVTIPTPRGALLIAVKNDLIFKQVDKMLAGNPAVVKTDEPGLSMRTTSLPPMAGLDLHPTVAQWNGFLVVATDDQIIRSMIAVQKGAPGYKSSPEYTTLSAGLPQQGNGFHLSTQRFCDVLSSFQSQSIANQPGTNAAQAAMMKRVLSAYQKNGRTFGVLVHLPNGWLSVSQGSFGTGQITPLAGAPAGTAGTQQTR